MSINPLAPGPGHFNLLRLPVVAAVLHADFDRSGVLDANDAERRQRLLRPGAIVLANLDLDDPPPAGDVDRADQTDVIKDDAINGGNDADELTRLRVRPTALAMSLRHPAAGVTLRVASADAGRIRIFEELAGAPSGWPARIRPGQAEYALTVTSGPSRADNFRVEALSLAGDPLYTPPGGATPNRPQPNDADLPSGSSGSPVYRRRAAAEIWVELVHTSGAGADLDIPYDVGLFTIAPYLLLSNLQPPEVVYVADIPDQTVDIATPATIAGAEDWPGNHPFVTDLDDTISGNLGRPAIAGVVLERIAYADCSTPADHNGTPIVTAAGDRATWGDPWVQDEFEIGYCWAPHAWMHVVLHCRRSGPTDALGKFVRRRLGSAGVGIFAGINAPDDSLNFGGNLEVSPPIDTPTPAQGADSRAGPAVRAHPRAALGKVLVGDSRTRPIHDDFRGFLNAQKAQPVVPINTAWLDVAHVDEFLSFVPAPRTAPPNEVGRKGWVMLIAWPDRAAQVLRRLRGVAGVTRMFRSKRDGATDLSRTVDQVLGRYTLTSGSRPLRNESHQRTLYRILRRLRRALDLADPDFIKIPVLYEPGVSETTSVTPNMVNCLVLGTDVIIPKPWGPRLPLADATTALTGVAGITAGMISSSNLDNLRGERYWARRGERLADIATTFGAPDHGVSEARIRADNATAGVNAAGEITAAWQRLWIEQDNVDILEAFVAVKLRTIGLTVHFLDDWDFYHAAGGNIHCGTNVKRRPPELTTPERWWDDYEELRGVADYAP